VPGTPWVDLSTVGAALNQDMLQQATGGLLFVPDLATMGRLQQMNVSFALDRLNRYDQQLIVATTATTQQLIEHGWDQAVLQRLGEVWLSLPPLTEHADEIPEFARLVLGHLVERGEASSHQFSTAALNALRLHPWGGGWSELQKTVRNLALTALEEEIEAAEVHAMLGGDDAATPDQLRELFGQVLREARDGFERLYFEHHLKREKNNMTRLAERTGLERTHLYRKLKQLGIAIGRRQEE
jgi:two-component system, NtrC family, nitrogen regulation response regulator NtrX